MGVCLLFCIQKFQEANVFYNLSHFIIGQALYTVHKLLLHAVIPGMRLDGKSSAYINAAFDIAKGKINGRKTVADQRRQVFNADSANAAVRNVGKKNDPDAARDRMIQRHAGEKED